MKEMKHNGKTKTRWKLLMRFKVKKQFRINPSKVLQSSWTAKRYVYTVFIAISSVLKYACNGATRVFIGPFH